MSDSVTGVPVFTLAELAVASAGANQIGEITETTVLGSNVAEVAIPRQRWDSVAVVAVSDHDSDGGDAAERAIFVQKSHNSIWRLAKAKLGTSDAADYVIPVPA